MSPSIYTNQSDKKLTRKQQRVLTFIESYIETNEQPPSLFELRDFLQLKTLSSVHHYLHSLEENKYLRRDRNQTKGIAYQVNSGKYVGQFIRVPMVGTITAGKPIDAFEEISRYIEIDVTELQAKSQKEYYALLVKGDSMIESGVHHGDIVVVEKRSNVKNGEMVVALLADGTATLKHIELKRDKITLIPANSSYKQKSYPLGEVMVQGIVTKIMKK